MVWYDTSKKGGNAPQGLRIKRARDDYEGKHPRTSKKYLYCKKSNVNTIIVSKKYLYQKKNSKN